MAQLPMPSEIKAATASSSAERTPVVEPPSAKLIVRLFLIPLIIVAAAVGIMFLIGRLAGGTPTFEEALKRLRSPGGERTATYLIGPGSKQRYMDAKTLVDRMKSGMSESQRVQISRDIDDIINNHTSDSEGEVRHALLLALGRAWQIDPSQAASQPADSAAAVAAKQQALATLLKFAKSELVSNRKAAILSMGYFRGHVEARAVLPVLVEKLADGREDIDVRIAAASVLGPLAAPEDRSVIDALRAAMNDSDPAHRELVWAAALSLAQLGEKDVAPTILMLLDRGQLAQLEVLDSETDPKNPTYRKLNEAEQQRYLINTMLGAAKLDVPEVRERIEWISKNDPSPRVREAAQEILQTMAKR